MKSVRIRAILNAMGFSFEGRKKGISNGMPERYYRNKENRIAYVYCERDRYKLASKIDKNEATEYLLSLGKQ